jgi:acyl carrier protein
MSTAVEQKIRDYILANYLFTGDASALGNDESFMKRGIIDSTGILEVIQFLHDEFGVQVADEEMIPENLDSVSNLVAFVARKNGVA